MIPSLRKPKAEKGRSQPARAVKGSNNTCNQSAEPARALKGSNNTQYIHLLENLLLARPINFRGSLNYLEAGGIVRGHTRVTSHQLINQFSKKCVWAQYCLRRELERLSHRAWELSSRARNRRAIPVGPRETRTVEHGLGIVSPGQRSALSNSINVRRVW